METFGNLDFKVGSVNPSGVGTEIYHIEKADIVSWPTAKEDLSAATIVSELTVLDGDFTLKAGAKWGKLYSTQGKAKATYETVGEVDCKMFNNKAHVEYPDLSPEALALSKITANGDRVYVVKAKGRFHVIGSPDYRCHTTSSGDTGDAIGSAKGISFDIECGSDTPLPIYAGELVLADGTLDCSDGSFSPAGA